MEADGNRRHRTYHFLGVEPLVQSGDWAIISLVLPPDPNQFVTDAMLNRHFLDHERGFRIAEISMCGMGAAFIRFQHTCDIDTAITNSPYFVGDSVLRVLRHDRGINHRDCTFTHDAWIMMVNFPLEAWRPDKVRESVSGFGKFLVWNKDLLNRARILIKVRVTNLLEIPVSHVICESMDDFGHDQS